MRNSILYRCTAILACLLEAQQVTDVIAAVPSIWSQSKMDSVKTFQLRITFTCDLPMLQNWNWACEVKLYLENISFRRRNTLPSKHFWIKSNKFKVIPYGCRNESSGFVYNSISPIKQNRLIIIVTFLYVSITRRNLKSKLIRNSSFCPTPNIDVISFFSCFSYPIRQSGYFI